MAVTSTDLHADQLRVGREPSQPRRISRMVFGLGRFGLLLEHSLFRLQKPKPNHPRLRGLLLLLLDPVAYELSPRLRRDKSLSLRQKIALGLVKQIRSMV